MPKAIASSAYIEGSNESLFCLYDSVYFSLSWQSKTHAVAVPAVQAEIKLKSLILAQIERWRHALHMQVERDSGGNPASRVANG